ncbi:cyanase [Tessaracoccus terricola]
MSYNAAKDKAGQQVREAKERAGVTWAQLAEAIGQPREWTISALLGMHPVPEAFAKKVGELLDLDADTVAALQRQPYRPGLGELANDPTIYRFNEAIAVYGAAIKEAIHEDFGDGIMSAIDFNVSVTRREDPKGDRIVVTFDGKYLTYPPRD